MLSVINNDEARVEARSPIDAIAREGARRMLIAALQAEADEYVEGLVGELDGPHRATFSRFFAVWQTKNARRS